MTRPDFPDNWHDLIAGHALGDLTLAEQAQLDKLVREHPNLRQELQAYEATLAQLPQALTAQSPPAYLENQILMGIHASEARNQESRRQDRANTFPQKYKYVGGIGTAIIASLLIILGWDNYRLRQSLTENKQNLDAANQIIRELQQNRQQTEIVLASLRTPEKALYSLLGTGDLINASGSVVTLAEERKAILIAHNLPSLPPDKIYRFWATTGTSESFVYCGQFNTQQDNTVQWSLPEETCGQQARQVMITVDPVAASTDAGGKLVMQSIPAQG